MHLNLVRFLSLGASLSAISLNAAAQAVVPAETAAPSGVAAPSSGPPLSPQASSEPIAPAAPASPQPLISQGTPSVAASPPASQPATPQAVPTSSNSAENAPDWSVGAGIGYTLIGYGMFQSDNAIASGSSAAALGASSSPSLTTPTPIAFLERRLARGAFALIQAEGVYSKTTLPTSSNEREAGGFAVEPGIRWILKPGAPVELGMAHVVYYAQYETTTTASDSVVTATNSSVLVSASHARSSTFGTATALVAERELIPQLWVRVGATFLRAYSSKTIVKYDAQGTTVPDVEAHAVGVRLGFEPSLSLRLAF